MGGAGDRMNEPCPCCGYLTLCARSQYDICPGCFWEDDGDGAPDDFSMPNAMTFSEGRLNFRRFGACDPMMINQVRKPLPHEIPQ
jgi:hypothetical protein